MCLLGPLGVGNRSPVFCYTFFCYFFLSSVILQYHNSLKCTIQLNIIFQLKKKFKIVALFPVVYILLHIYFVFVSITLFCPSLSTVVTTCFFIIFKFLFCCIRFFLFVKIPHISENMVSVFLWDNSLSIIHSRPIHVIVNGRIFFLWLRNVPLCVYIYTYTPPLLYWVICLWTPEWLPLLDNCK